MARAGELDLAISVPARAPHPVDSVIALELEGDPVVDEARLLSTAVPADTLRAFDAQLVGGLAFGAGKVRDAWVHKWTRPDQQVRWPVRLAQPASFDVAITYDAPAPSAGGRFEVRLGDKLLAGTVQPTPAGPVAARPGVAARRPLRHPRASDGDQGRGAAAAAGDPADAGEVGHARLDRALREAAAGGNGATDFPHPPAARERAPGRLGNRQAVRVRPPPAARGGEGSAVEPAKR